LDAECAPASHDPILGGDRHFFDPRPVHERSIARAHVADQAALPIAAHSEMDARQVSILGQRIVGLLGTADSDDGA
jgi:hypothetical protein